MAGDWSNLGDTSVFQGLPLPASPVTSSGEDPDELREMMAQRAAQQGTQMGARMAQQNPIARAAPPTQAQPAQPAQGGPATENEPPGFNADIARQAMTGEIASGRNLTDTAGQMQPDPAIAQLEQKKMADEAAAPNAANYKPGFGTRVLRGLKGAALGAAQGGIFGAATGALDPGLVAGGRAYSAPTDAYDVALGKNKQLVASDTESLQNAQNSFQEAQKLREAREKAYTEGDTAFKGAGTTATTQEGEESKAAQLPIDKEKADTEQQKVFNEGPDGKLKISQGEIDQRTRLADQMKMAPGFMRTRYILTGEVQPGREPTAEEIAVNRILGTWKTTHGGQGPQSVQDWQGIYAAAKGGTGAGGADNGKDLREAAGLASKRVKDLTDLMGSKGAVLWDANEKAQHQRDLDDAKNELATLQAQLIQPAGGAGGAAQPPAGAGAGPQGGPPTQIGPENTFSPDGRFYSMGGGWVKATGDDGKVRMRVPNPANPKEVRYARFTPDKAAAAAKMGATFAGMPGQ